MLCHMAFAMCPDSGPNRLYRYVSSGVLKPGVLAQLDAARNILFIDRELFGCLSEAQKRALMKTRNDVTYAPSNKVLASL